MYGKAPGSPSCAAGSKPTGSPGSYTVRMGKPDSLLRSIAATSVAALPIPSLGSRSTYPVSTMRTFRPLLTVSGPVALALVAAVVAVPPAASAAGSGEPVGGPLMQGADDVVDLSGGAEPLPTVRAASFALVDATTGEVLAARGPHKRHRPASTLKTLTALTLLEQGIDPGLVYTATWDDVAVEGSRAGLVEGGTYSVDDLFYAMLLPSGNDAATALANAGGGVKRTVKRMNALARELQANDTHAANPTGLDADGQYSSAYDLALIASAALTEHPEFRAYVSTLQHPFPGQPTKNPKKRGSFDLWNQNRLVQQGYSGIAGVKTGWTTLAGRTFVAAAERKGHLLVVALMDIRDSSDDAARALLDWGFDNRKRAVPVGVLVPTLSSLAPAATPTPSPTSSPTAEPSTSASAVSAGVGGAASDGGWFGAGWGSPWAWAAVAVLVLVLVLLTAVTRRRRSRRRRVLPLPRF